MDLISELQSGRTLGEIYGVTAEIGRAIAELAVRELEGGRLENAHAILEGLAVANPHDAAAWCLLALVERRRGRLLAARLCAETARRLAPDDLQIRLVRAEVLLATSADRQEGRHEIAALAAAEGHVGDRARALRAAMAAA